MISSLNILFQGNYSNGFFYRKMDLASKDSHTFNTERYRDRYFHASFEIPFILLTYSPGIDKVYKSLAARRDPVALRQFRFLASLLRLLASC